MTRLLAVLALLAAASIAAMWWWVLREMSDREGGFLEPSEPPDDERWLGL